MKVYFVTVGLREEIEVIRKLRPPHLLCSYWYFKHKNMSEFFNSIGYEPKVMLDSGAYSAFTKGQSVNLFDYMKYIAANDEYLSQYVALDVIGDTFSTLAYYEIMINKGFRPIPVYHYGDDPAVMNFYIAAGAKVVALGNTVPIRDKSEVAQWCKELHAKQPDISLHLLGSCSQKIIDCGAVASCDSSTWYVQAVNGYPKDIPGKEKTSKISRAEANMIRIMEEFNESSVPFNNSCRQYFDGEIQPVNSN